MNNFIVSARKYRPVTFDTVVGQHTITTTLKNAIRNKQLAQAFLFCGPRGVGKTTCARILAKTINCENPTENIEPCNECISCKSFNESTSFNIHELDAASNNSVDDIRNLVDQVRIPPQMGIYKVYIIDEVHMLSASAFNAFLKTLEEPPAYAKFILATTEKHKIIPTILSRCQIFDFRRITVEDIARHLLYVATNEGVKADEEALHIIAQKADGAMRDSLSIFDQMVSMCGNSISYEQVIENLNVLDYDYYFKITDSILAGDLRNTMLILNEIIEKGFEGQHFINGLADHFRNLMMCRDSQTIKLIESSESVKNRYLLQAKNCSNQFLLSALELANKCDVNYRISNNKRLHIEIALMQICTLGQSVQNNPASSLPPQPSISNRPVNISQATGVPATSAPVTSTVKEVPGVAPLSAPPPIQPTSVDPPMESVPLDRKTNTVENSDPGQATGQAVTIQYAESKNPGLQPGNEGTAFSPPISGTEENAPVKIAHSAHPTSSRPGAFSIKNAIQAPVGDSESFSVVSEPGRFEGFSQDTLESAWNEFANVIKNDSQMVFTALVQRKPFLAENSRVHFEVENSISQTELNEYKSRLILFLRDKLLNDTVELDISIAATQNETRKLYTDKEKFDSLKSINPSVKNMKDQLGLEFEL